MFYTGLIICWTLKNNYLNIFAFSYRLSEKKNYFQSYFETISKKKIARFIPHKYTANIVESQMRENHSGTTLIIKQEPYRQCVISNYAWN